MEYSSLQQLAFTAMGTHVPHGSHSVTHHPAEVTFLPLPQPINLRLVLNLATLEGFKAELI